MIIIKDSQFGDVLGDALGQGVEVFVAAAHHGLQAGTLPRALWLRQAAGLLLTWGTEGNASVRRGGGERH